MLCLCLYVLGQRTLLCTARQTFLHLQLPVKSFHENVWSFRYITFVNLSANSPLLESVYLCSCGIFAPLTSITRCELCSTLPELIACFKMRFGCCYAFKFLTFLWCGSTRAILNVFDVRPSVIFTIFLLTSVIMNGPYHAQFPHGILWLYHQGLSDIL